MLMLQQACCGSHARCNLQRLSKLSPSKAGHLAQARTPVVHLLSSCNITALPEISDVLQKWLQGPATLLGSFCEEWLRAGLVEALITFMGEL
jgi:hypothetical protein